MINEVKEILISKETKETIEKFLSMERDEFKKINTYEGDVLSEISAPFKEKNKEITIQLISTGVDCYLNIILYEVNGPSFSELMCLDPEYKFENSIEIEFNNVKFIVKIKVDDKVFEKYSLNEFNSKFKMKLHEKMSLVELTDEFDMSDMNCVYAAYDAKNVIDSCIAFYNETGFDYTLLNINDYYIGVYSRR